jgi:small GTP-binding protein
VNASADFRHQFKVLMLGDSCVGKTALLNRFVYDRYNMNFHATIGIDYRFRNVAVYDKDGEHKVRLAVWDTAGQERFRTITRHYYRGAQGIALVYDSTDRGSFENVDNWLASIHEQGDAVAGVAVILVANKCDLPNQVVPPEEGQELAKHRGIRFFRTSAKDDINVNELFTALTVEMERRLRRKKEMDVKKQPTSQSAAPIKLVSREHKTRDRRDGSCCGGGSFTNPA